MIRSLGRRKAIFNGSGACALGLLGSVGCEELAFCEGLEVWELELCDELEVAEPEVCAELWPEFGPLPVVLPGSGGGG
jgi:hypothetical protein